MDPNKRREVAIWRMNILGPLISARLDHGERRALFEEAAARSYTAPNGKQTRLSWRTIENWYYAYKAEGLSGLEPRPRADRGEQRAISDDVAEHILALRRENPRRSIRVLIKAMVRARKVTASSLTRSSVARLLRAHGLSQRPRALPERERRAFTVEHPARVLRRWRCGLHRRVAEDDLRRARDPAAPRRPRGFCGERGDRALAQDLASRGRLRAPG